MGGVGQERCHHPPDWAGEQEEIVKMLVVGTGPSPIRIISSSSFGRERGRAGVYPRNDVGHPDAVIHCVIGGHRRFSDKVKHYTTTILFCEHQTSPTHLIYQGRSSAEESFNNFRIIGFHQFLDADVRSCRPSSNRTQCAVRRFVCFLVY